MPLLARADRISKVERADLRYKCKSDLWFLNTEVFGVPLIESLHRPLCDEFFVKKDPSKSLKDQPETIRERLLLYPRFAWKTTLQASDACQWLITFPDITVAINTGDGDLSDAIVALVKSYFAVEGWDGKRNDAGEAIWNDDARPTLFHKLFSEYVVPVSGGGKGRADTYFSPARKTKIKDPSLYSLSILSSSAGWRCSVLMNDDVVNETNMDSPAVLEKIAKRVTMSRKLLPKYGFRQTVGTRFHVSDVYGKMLRDNNILGEVPYGRFEVKGKPGFKCWIMPSWWVKGTGRRRTSMSVRHPPSIPPRSSASFCAGTSGTTTRCGRI